MNSVIIFDFDGTIANSFDLIIKSFNQIAPSFNLPVITDSEKKIIRNLSAGELLKKYKVTPLKLLRLIKKIKLHQAQNFKSVSPVSGILKLFEDLKNNNFKLGIVTSNSKKNVLLFLGQWNIKGIDFIYSEKNLFGKGKVLKNLIRKQNLKKDSVIYVGDEVRDIEAAHMAKIKVIAVDWGFNSKERLIKAKPDFLISEPKEILRINNI